MISYTNRGFELVKILDHNGQVFEVQQSSAIIEMESPGASALWIGLPPDRGHLSRKQVRELAYRLLHWYNTGSLRLPTDKDESQ